MTFPLPQGELLRRAAAHMTTCLKESSDRSLTSILDETSMRFNLSPLEGQSLLRLFDNTSPASDMYVGHTNLSQK